jgi:2-methylisocitrate lyase-like PEP mutase family enzyme
MSDDKLTRFRTLHESGCFAIPNPWDAGSAKVLVQLGFVALATTSSGFAWSLGKQDNHTTLDEALAHYRALAAAVDVPVSADFEGAFAVQPDEVAKNVRAASQTGIAGLSVEDSTGDASQPLFDFDLALARVRAARAATGLVLTARCESFVTGHNDLDETIRRLKAYADAGADCLHAPGLRDHAQIRAVVDAVKPKAVNVLCSTPFATVEQLRELGVRRISVGGALARTAWSGFLEAAQEIAQHGTFNALGRAVTGVEMNRRFA